MASFKFKYYIKKKKDINPVAVPCGQTNRQTWRYQQPPFEILWMRLIKRHLLCVITYELDGHLVLDSNWNVMAHGDAREGKWRGNWRMEWVASTLHNTSEHGVSSITTADAHTSAASSRLNWRPRRFKWTRPLRRKTKSGFCACAITFKTQSNT